MYLLEQLREYSKELASKHENDGLVIIIGGAGASGSSTIAKMLSDYFGLPYVYGGQKMRALARENGYPDIKDFVVSDEMRSSQGEFDLMVEKYLLKELYQGSVLIDSKTLGALCHLLNIDVSAKIWLDASIDVRAKRALEKLGETYAGNEQEYEQKLASLSARLDADTVRYNNTYGIDYGNQGKYNDIVIDSSGLDVEQTFNIVLNKLNDGGYIPKDKFK